MTEENIKFEIVNIDELEITDIDLDIDKEIEKEVEEFEKKDTKGQIISLRKLIKDIREKSDSDKVKDLLKEEDKKLCKLYYQDFKERNKEKINQTIECSICGGNYTYFNKSRHLKTKRCLSVKKIRGM